MQVKKQFKLIASEYTANKYNLASNAFQSGNFEKAIEYIKNYVPLEITEKYVYKQLRY